MSSSSSGEEDGDAEWRAAIDSVASDFNLPAPTSTANGSIQKQADDSQRHEKSDSRAFKLYQTKAQKLLEDMLEKNLAMVRDPTPALDRSPENSEGGVRLFRGAPRGIIFDPFKRRLESVAVDGISIMAAAKEACQRSLARFEAKDAAAKAVAKREEERVTELKWLRGEKWLPSIAREMQKSANAVGTIKRMGR
ncbi:hypothetical protein ACLOJK_003553 [Asimina triloba]